MKALAISDIHGKFEIFDYIKQNHNKNDFDFLTISGDIWEGFSTNGRYKLLALQDKFKKPIIIIQGNHDFWDNGIFKHDKNIHLLHNESITIDGVVFYGSPYSPKFMSWNWMQTEDNLYNIWDSTMPDKIDVALMHTPPYGYCDNCNQESYGNNRDTKLGSPALNKIMDNRKIVNMFVGHIHTGDRFKVHSSGTKVYNVCCLDEEYTFMGFNSAPKIIEI